MFICLVENLFVSTLWTVVPWTWILVAFCFSTCANCETVRLRWLIVITSRSNLPINFVNKSTSRITKVVSSCSRLCRAVSYIRIVVAMTWCIWDTFISSHAKSYLVHVLTKIIILFILTRPIRIAFKLVWTFRLFSKVISCCSSHD